MPRFRYAVDARMLLLRHAHFDDALTPLRFRYAMLAEMPFASAAFRFFSFRRVC